MSSVFSSIATARERSDLADAIAHNCECQTLDGQLLRCASHTLALARTPADELTLERLLFVRRVLLPTLAAQEFGA
jgi:hypothetical protein